MTAPLQIGERSTLQAVVVGAVIVDICEALIESGALVDPERLTCAACGCLSHPHELCPGCRAITASAARREVVRDV
jgi:hypothetical protein